MNLQNLIDFGQIRNIDIFAGVSVPEPLQADTVKSAIMVRCGLLTPVYPEPDIMQSAITHWFNTKQWTFTHLINVIKADYSPIENYDRYENWTDDHTGTQKNAGTQKNIGENGEEHTGDDITENTVSAYNADSYQPDNKQTLNHGENIKFSNNDTRTDDFTRTDALQDKHDAHIHGNIGTMTNQTMIQQELDLLRHFDIYTYIAKLFEEDFCLMVY